MYNVYIHIGSSTLLNSSKHMSRLRLRETESTYILIQSNRNPFDQNLSMQRCRKYCIIVYIKYCTLKINPNYKIL